MNLASQFQCAGAGEGRVGDGGSHWGHDGRSLRQLVAVYPPSGDREMDAASPRTFLFSPGPQP